jgi:hypothetical protein
VEGRALEVLRSSLLLHAPNPTHTLIYNALVTAFWDTSEGEWALQKLQSLTQKGDIKAYIWEFNTLRGLAASIATLDPNAMMRYFVQGLHMNIKIRTAAAVPATVEAAQVVARAMDLVLGRQHDGIKGEPMNTFIGQRDEKPKGTCNWCGYKDHFEHECRQKAGGKPRKVSSSSTPNISHGPLKCFHCGREGHHVTECKAKIVFTAEESESETNKNDSSYVNVYGEKGLWVG